MSTCLDQVDSIPRVVRKMTTRDVGGLEDNVANLIQQMECFTEAKESTVESCFLLISGQKKEEEEAFSDVSLLRL